MDPPRFRGISAVTLATRDMARAVRFYHALGLGLVSGGVIHVDDVDGLHARACAAGLAPEATPRNAAWGERYFQLTDPDGHQLSFARPL